MSDVVELDPNNPKATVCGTCGRGWDDSISTSVTPTPAGRCPFEYEHDQMDDRYVVTFQPMVFTADDKDHAIEQYLDALGFTIDEDGNCTMNIDLMDILVSEDY